MTTLLYQAFRMSFEEKQHAFRMSFKEIQQARRLLTSKARDNVDKKHDSRAARGPKGDGKNVKLGFGISIITIQRLATVLPHLQANDLHAVGIFP